MRDRVDAGGRGHARGQRQRQVDVVEHGLRQDLRARLRGLQAAAGLAEDRRHFRARHSWSAPPFAADRCAARSPCRARSSNRRRRRRDHRPARADLRHRLLGDVDRRVHGRAGEQPGGAGADQRDDLATLRLLRRGGENQRPRDRETLELGGQLGQRSGAEHDPRRRRLIDKPVHRPLLAWRGSRAMTGCRRRRCAGGTIMFRSAL